MNREFDILIFKIKERLIGIDCKEILRAVNDISTDKNKFEKNIKKINPDKIFKFEAGDNYNSALFIENRDKKKFYLYISSVEGIERINSPDIYIIPDYLKKRQEPFFVWGFLESDKIVTLITFDYFNK